MMNKNLKKLYNNILIQKMLLTFAVIFNHNIIYGGCCGTKIAIMTRKSVNSSFYNFGIFHWKNGLGMIL